MEAATDNAELHSRGFAEKSVKGNVLGKEAA